MKKLLWAVGGLLLVCVLAIAILPVVIDWNDYKSTISAEVKKATGRDLVIAGDISLDIFPTPTLMAERVSLSNVEGAQSPDLVSLRSVEVRIALAPLLGGNVRVETVRLIEPQVFLEVLANGSTSWTITPPDAVPAGDEGTAASSAPGQGGSSGPAISVDQFEIVDGSLIYQDAASGSLEEITNMNLEVAAASLADGPYRARGSLVARNFRLGINADVGAVVEGRTFPLNIAVGVGGDSAEVRLIGTVLGLNEAPRFRGDIEIESPNIGKIADAFADGAKLPAPLNQSLKIVGVLDATETALSMENVSLDFGGSKGTGVVRGTLGSAPKIAAEFKIDRIDAEPWVKAVVPTQAAASSSPAGETTVADTVSTASSGAETAFALPSGISVSLASRIGEIAVNGDVVRNVVLNAELANGELTLSQASLQGPGGTDAAIFGFLAAREGKPSFDASVDLKIKEPRTLMAWAGIDAAGLKPGKPGALTLTGRLGGTPGALNLRDLVVGVDGTTIRGAATVALRDRLGVGASVVIDTLDLDAYLADGEAASAPAQTPTQGGATTPGGDAPANDAVTAGPFDGLKVLDTFDANVRAKVGTLKVQGVPIRDVDADLSLVGGDLTIKKFTVGNLAGAGISANGAVKALGKTPVADNLSLRANIANAAGLAALGGFEQPVSAKTLGKIDFLADIDGRLDTPTVAATLSAMSAQLKANGSVRPLDAVNMFDLGVALRHPDTARFLRQLGVSYTPSGKIGGLDISTRLKGGPAQIAFSDLSAVSGPAQIGGEGTVSLGGIVPKVNAVLRAGALVVDPFLPAQKSAALAPEGAARVVPAAFRIDADGRGDLLQLIAATSKRWSSDPIDLSGLTAVDADVLLTAPAISYREYKLDNAKLLSVLKGGVLKVTEFTGQIFGGSLASTATVDASRAKPELGASVSVAGMDIGAASAAAGIAGGSGRLTSRADVTTLGMSVADWIGSLSGGGAVDIKGIKGQQSLSDMPVIGLMLGPLMQIFEVLNSGLGAIIGAGGKAGLGETDVTSTFTVTNGVVNTKDTKIISNLYQGNIAGDVNLPVWSMNIGGDLAIDQGLVGTVLANIVRVPSKIPFQVTGDIDKPNVKIQSFTGSTSQGGEGIKIPGLDKLEKKAPGVGNLLQGILGGGSAQQQQAPAPTTNEPPSQDGTTPPAQEPVPQQQQQNPINQLLRGLIR